MAIHPRVEQCSVSLTEVSDMLNNPKLTIVGVTPEPTDPSMASVVYWNHDRGPLPPWITPCRNPQSGPLHL